MKPIRKTSSTQFFVLLFFFISGFAGLIYQILWARQFKLLLGSSVTSISIVIGAFMLGLLLGAWFIGKKIDKNTFINELRLYGFLELGIGLYALLLLLGFNHLIPLYSFIGEPTSSFNNIRLITNLVLTFAILAPPTFAMGATLPLLINFFSRTQLTFRNATGKLYAINALGGAAAALIAGFFLIEHYGVSGSILIAVSTNLIIGSLSLLASRKIVFLSTKNDLDKVDHSVRAKILIHPKTLLILSFVSGLIAISYEVLWIRCLNYILNNSTYTFSIILATFLLGISIGSYIVSLLKKKFNAYVTLGYIQYSISIFSILLIFLFYSFGDSEFISQFLSQGNKDIPSWYQDIGANLLFSILVFLIPTILMGMSFPLIAELYYSSIAEKAGSAISKVYVYNTLGSILGAIIPIFLLIPLLEGIKPTLYLFSILNLGLAIFFILRSAHKRKWIINVIGVAVFLITIKATLTGKELISIERTDPTSTLFYEEGKMATIRVFKDEEELKSLSIDDVTIASEAYKAKESTIAHLPFFTNDVRKKVLVVGLASGSTSYSILKHQEVEQVDIVEIVPSVLNALEYFKPSNQNLKTNPKVKIYINDIISHLNYSQEKYDVISSDGKFSFLNKANTVMLSQDYYKLCKSHLNKNGLFIQWVSLKIPNLYFKTILSTVESVFDYSELFLVRQNMFIVSSSQPIYLDQKKIVKAFNNKQISDDLYQSNVYSSTELLSSYIGPNKGIYETDKLNTFDTPYIEYGYSKEHKKDQDSHGLSTLKNLSLLKNSFIQNENTIKNSINTISRNENQLSFEKNLSFINSRINYIKGISAKDKGELDLSREFLLKVVAENHPDNINDVAISSKIIGEYYLNDKKNKESLPFLDNAIEKINSFEQAYLLRGIAYYNLNQYDKSKNDFNKVISLNPYNQAANQYLKRLRD